ncbi:MAG: hypothetical protein IIC90_12555 [Chloroflexi bacterium]|nr:hypothetical protein [Chloroflexota bacterium]
MQGRQTRLRIGFGLVAMAAVLALVAFMTMVGTNSGGNSVSAGAPPTPTPKPGTDGNLSGIFDREFTNPSFTVTLYHCISRTDHDATTNVIKSSSQCYADLPGLADPADVLADVNVPGEGPTAGNGPPPPPPYTNHSPTKGIGFFDKDGTSPECVFYFPAAASCSVVFSCFEDLGAGSFGPNVGVRFVTGDPMDNPSFGKVELNTGLSNADCDSLTMPAIGTNAALDFKSTRAAIGSVPWRTNATDFDGDGCTDLDELDENKRPKGCGDDPYNPLDSNQTNYAGAYDILIRVTRAESTIGFGGAYFSCLADIQQDGTGKDTSTTTPGLTARVFCYQDSFEVINSLGSPGVTGDGYPGGGPPWGAIPQEGPDPEDIATECGRWGLAGTGPGTLDEDGDTVPNDGCPSGGFGDVDSKQTVLTGYIDNADNTLKLRGCFEDEDASSTLQNVYTEVSVNRNTGVGTTDIWALQTLGNCTGSHAFGTYVGDGGHIGPPIASFDDADVSIVRQPGGQTRDTDQDGIPNAVELRDNGTSDCGLRDPYNPYDWYDVNQDGVIDLLNDILGVISHYSPGGAPPYDANWDRPPSMTGGAGHWNRGAPDGVIDLLNDILGVISQYHPGAC